MRVFLLNVLTADQAQGPVVRQHLPCNPCRPHRRRGTGRVRQSVPWDAPGEMLLFYYIFVCSPVFCLGLFFLLSPLMLAYDWRMDVNSYVSNIT